MTLGQSTLLALCLNVLSPPSIAPCSQLLYSPLQNQLPRNCTSLFQHSHAKTRLSKRFNIQGKAPDSAGRSEHEGYSAVNTNAENESRASPRFTRMVADAVRRYSRICPIREVKHESYDCI
jgi:hypothetical protein